jgi:hypothetical protein
MVLDNHIENINTQIEFHYTEIRKLKKIKNKLYSNLYYKKNKEKILLKIRNNKKKKLESVDTIFVSKGKYTLCFD